MPTERKYADLKPGDRVGRLTIVGREPWYDKKGRNHGLQYVCRCDCGNKVTVKPRELFTGKTKSCGCYSKETTSVRGHIGVYGVFDRNKAGYKGVCRPRSNGRWLCDLVYRGKRYHSYHDTPEEAARAYDELAIELRGPDACINFPEDHPEHRNRKPARRIP